MLLIDALNAIIDDGIEAARAEVESGKTIELVILPIYTGLGFSVWSAGDVSMLRLAGLLSCAWMDAVEALREKGSGDG